MKITMRLALHAMIMVIVLIISNSAFARDLEMKIVFVTSSSYKFPQVQRWVKELDPAIHIVQGEYDLCEPQSLDIEEVAAQKARNAWQRFRRPLIVDDMGVHFADYPQFPGTFTRYIFKSLGLNGFWKLLKDNSRGWYEYCIAYIDENGIQLFKSRVDGRFIEVPHTSGVHARAQIDRIFIPDGSSKTISEMEDTPLLREFSGRYKALQELVAWLVSRGKVDRQQAARNELLLSSELSDHADFGELLQADYETLTASVELLRQLPSPPVTIFGSSRLSEDSTWYQKAKELGGLLAEKRISVMTGGGPGIMRAVSDGIVDSSQPDMLDSSFGVTIKKLHSAGAYAPVGHRIFFNNFFFRKLLLINYSRGFVLFPGGYGTIDELAEVLMLIQTKRRPLAPIILIGHEFWDPFLSWLTSTVVQEYQCIRLEETESFIVTDSVEEAASRIY